MALPATRASDDDDSHHAQASPAQPPAQHTQAPPAKRVRREYPWRAEFEREFGVRPIQVDAASGDAVLVECRFCVSFGREPPAVAASPAVNKAGQPIKSRARTRNVAHWKYPFRTDNMRSHHLQQHARKWTEYSVLLEQAKQQMQQQADAPKGDGAEAEEDEENVSGRVSALERLNAFFGGPDAEGAIATAPTAQATTQAVSNTSAVATISSGTVLLTAITNTAIVDAVLPAMIDIPSVNDDDLSTPEGAQVNHLLVPVKTTNSGIDEDAVVTQYSVVGGPVSNHRGVVRLLEAGLCFRQVAELTRSLQLVEAPAIARGDVVEFARALVASGLQRVADLMAASWTYSVRLTVHAPSSDRAPTPLRVSVRVPVDESRVIEEFHLVTLALHQSSESKKRVSAYLPVLFAALDRNFQQKLLSVTIDGATNCLGVHAQLAERVVRPLLSEPSVSFYDGEQDVNRTVQSAWALFRDQADQRFSFSDPLLGLIASARADSEVVGSHPHIPLVQLDDARSVMRALAWLIPRRDSLANADIDAPVWWWLTAHVLLEVWMDCLAATSDSTNGAQRSDRNKSHGTVDQLVKSLTSRCGITIAKEKDVVDKTNDASAAECVVEYNEKTRVASVRAAFTGSRLSWASKDIAYCLRALNVSTRRMFAELTKDSALLLTTERQVSRVVLLLVSQLQRRQLEASSTTVAPAPTLPLEYAAIAAPDVVDFVETHSRRLEAAFPTVFLDVVSREIRDLQTLLASNEPLRDELARVADAATASSFAAAWALLPQFAAVRTLAAGLGTARPAGSRADAVDSRLLAFGRAENDETPRGAVADLALEAHAHARQLQRLQRGGATSPDSLVV